MDLINDLSSDVAFAVLVEKTHDKLDSRDAKSLIERIESELTETLRNRPKMRETNPREH